MLGLMRQVWDGAPGPVAKLTAAELKNVLEQERLVTDAIRVQKMLAAALQGTMAALAANYSLPKVFELDRETGEIFKKEPSDG